MKSLVVFYPVYTSYNGIHVWVDLQERMSLKHRGGSKFMKQQMVYGKYDDKVCLDRLCNCLPSLDLVVNKFSTLTILSES